MGRNADAVVIGAGINGCATAYHLAKRGLKKVVLLEQRFVASGPTGRSSGIIRQHYTLPTLALMARDSLRTFQHFADETGDSAGFVQCGVVFLAGEAQAPQFQCTVAMHQQLGIRTSLLSPQDLLGLDSLVHVDDVACASYEPDGGYADPTLAANAFCNAARAAGVEVRLHTPATGIRLERGQVAGVITATEEISTGEVVNVAGPWGANVAAMVGVDIPITPSRHCVVMLQRPRPWRESTPVWADLINAAYYKPDGVDRIMVGSISQQEGEAGTDIEGYSSEVDYETIAAYSELMAKRFPVMNEGEARGGWAGLYDVTPDWQPVIASITDVPGFHCAVGFSGHGFKLAPAVGRIMAELVLDGRCSSYDISPFRYERFSQGKLSHSAYAYGIIG